MYKNFLPLSTLSSFPSLKAFILSPSILSLQSTSSPILTLHHRWLGTLFYMTFLFVVAVILLNLLIAQFSSTYEDVTEKAKVSVTLNRTKILAGMEKLIWTLLVSLMQPSFIPPVVIFVFCNRERVLWLRWGYCTELQGFPDSHRPHWSRCVTCLAWNMASSVVSKLLPSGTWPAKVWCSLLQTVQEKYSKKRVSDYKRDEGMMADGCSCSASPRLLLHTVQWKLHG